MKTYKVSGTVIALYIYYLMPSLPKLLEVCTIIKSISQKRKLRHREVRSLIHGHIASRQRSQDWKAGFWLQAVPGEMAVLACLVRTLALSICKITIPSCSS